MGLGGGGGLIEPVERAGEIDRVGGARLARLAARRRVGGAHPDRRQAGENFSAIGMAKIISGLSSAKGAAANEDGGDGLREDVVASVSVRPDARRRGKKKARRAAAPEIAD